MNISTLQLFNIYEHLYILLINNLCNHFNRCNHLPTFEKEFKNMSEQNTSELVRKIFEAYLENKNLRKTPERFAILEEI